MEPLRKAAEKAVRGPAGVSSVTAVLTAHREISRPQGSPGGGKPSSRAPAQRPAPAAGSRPRAGRGPAPWCPASARSSRWPAARAASASRPPPPTWPWPGHPGPQGRPAGRRHLRPLPAAHAGHQRPAHLARRQDPHPDGELWRQVHVHGLPGGRGHADDLARPHGPERPAADAAGRRLGRARHAGGRHAAGHRRRPADHGPAGAL